MKHRIQESPDDNGKTSANITINLNEEDVVGGRIGKFKTSV